MSRQFIGIFKTANDGLKNLSAFVNLKENRQHKFWGYNKVYERQFRKVS